jgi:deoxyribonuclease-4
MSNQKRDNAANMESCGKTGKKPRFGAHMSVAGGLENAFAAGEAVGCDCLQIFVKNQRQWRAGPLTDEQIARFRKARSATGLAPVVAHASYLLNLASPSRNTRDMSVNTMVDELTRCEALGVEALVFHPGSHMNAGDTKPRSDEAGKGNNAMQSEPQAPARGLDPSLALRVPMETEAERAGIERIAESLDEVHRQCSGFATMILLESTAGQGSAIGWHFGQLAAILDRVRESDRLGVCLDTCHLFAAGYDFRTAEGYAAMIDELDRTVGVSRVRCIHTNDSKRELGSRVDRHEHIGKGKIGKAGFVHFVNDPRFVDVPFILETPKGKDGRGTDLDRVNLKRLRAMIVD